MAKAAWILFALPGVLAALLWPHLTVRERVWGSLYSISFYALLDVIPWVFKKQEK